MKTVFTNSELPHIWARQTQDNGRTSNGSMYFNGSRIYSYGRHFCMADIINPSTVLICDRTYSPTTSRHQSEVRYAVNHLKQVRCPHPESFRDSLNVWESRIKTQLSIIGHARKRQTSKDKAKGELLSIVSDIKSYLEVTGNKLNRTTHKEFIAYMKAAESEKAAGQLAGKLERQRVADEKARIEREREARAEALNNLELWRKGEIERLPWNNYDLPVALRLVGDQIETSKGAVVNTEPAKRLLTLIRAGKDVKGFNIDGYTVIGLNGVLKVGCHEITRDEIERFTTLNNW